MRQHRAGESDRPEAASEPEPGKRRRVLVVDDDRQVAGILAEALRQWGYVAFEANSAEELIGIARQQAVDAALIDVRMPEVDGFGALQILKENNERLVAVMMTGYGELEGAERAMRIGAYDYITKPFDLRDMRAVLEAGLKEQAGCVAREDDAPIESGA